MIQNWFDKKKMPGKKGIMFSVLVGIVFALIMFTNSGMIFNLNGTLHSIYWFLDGVVGVYVLTWLYISHTKKK